MSERNDQRNDISIGSMITRVLVSMLILAIVAFFTPFFSIKGFMPLFIAAIFIGVIDYLIEKMTGFDATPFGRGIIGFVVSAVIIYITGMVVSGVRVSMLGAVLAALAIGIINMIIPGKRVL
ncbi:phage holin family protein [Inediibacterium massiliense]|uniref:phage holin family protein n=1 Tax=Inediibacterium massiliense TaxID=1658111 RepID=UPI001FA6CFC9|nr:phage holin family protein [Inediibacterium massiliense]